MEDGSKSGGGVEVRSSINVVYFLSRDGKVEHPHLVRVHHLHSNAIRLTDVKRWLSELRGKEMPESFSWSYKRRYKSGYVWEDLADGDLIMPLSDNEYVLKGSELRPSTHSAELPPECERSRLLVEPKKEAAASPEPKEKDMERRCDSGGRSSSSSSGRSARRKLLSLLGCGAAETEESVVLRVKRQEEEGESGGRDLLVGGSRRRSSSFSGCPTTNHQHQRRLVAEDLNSARKSWSDGRKSSRKTGEKVVPAAYRPLLEPNCSQCGKAFKPEKLHSHMKSCKALRARIKKNCGNLEKKPLKCEISGEASPDSLVAR